LIEINYCRNCGSDINKGQTVCLNCGFEPLYGNQYCQNCQSETKEGQKLCVNCGFELLSEDNRKTSEVSGRGNDEKSFGLNLISFIFPFIGLILYIVFNTNYPIKAGSIARSAVAGVIIESAIAFVLWG